MIQFNLLPEVKLQYLKAERTSRLVISGSVLVGAVAVIVTVLLLSTTILQRKHLSDLDANIKVSSAKITGQTNLDKVLTVQNQLESLTALHAGKPAASQLTTYLNQVTPASVNLNNLSIDFTQQTVTLSGTADSLASINQYVDTLKFTTYTSTNVTKSTPAFSNVVLSSFGLSTHEASYTISLSYDKNIFDITQTVHLKVPQQVTTRSQLDQPTDLFQLPIDATNSGTGKAQ